jgi:hypothetical protein
VTGAADAGGTRERAERGVCAAQRCGDAAMRRCGDAAVWRHGGLLLVMVVVVVVVLLLLLLLLAGELHTFLVVGCEPESRPRVPSDPSADVRHGLPVPSRLELDGEREGEREGCSERARVQSQWPVRVRH